MAFLLCGQTDSGKSTISGHLLYKVGYFNELTEDDKKFYRKELDNIDGSNSKSKYSILMDLMDGEILTNKTKTQEFNICPFNYNNNEFVLIDTPGHKLYIRSLIAGLFKLQIDIVCLVVSSIDNEFTESFDRGTIKEDLVLARSTGCKNLLILWNKCDISKPTDDMIYKLNSYSKKLAYKKIDSLQVSGYTGDNLLSILEKVNYYRSTDKLSQSSSENVGYTDKLSINCMFFKDELNTLISAGYSFIIHYTNGEIDCEIINIIQQGKPIRIIKDNSQVIIRVKLSSKINISKSDRLIFRDKDNTIGFGIVSEIYQ